MQHLKYKELKLQTYMENTMFSMDQISLLLSLRTRTVRGIRSDFGHQFPDKYCPLIGCDEIDSLQHVLDCRVLQLQLQGEGTIASHIVSYMDVFSSDMMKQHEATVLYTQLLGVRERLILDIADSIT